MIITDNLTSFFGVVEDNNDPNGLGRVRVRCYGFHTQNTGELPTEYLQWFSCITNNSSGVSGIGSSPTGYVTGTTVFGFFLNSTLQDGVVLGSLSGQPSKKPPTGLGFNDPNGKYPLYDNESDVNRLARGQKDHWIYEIQDNARVKDMQKAVDGGNEEKIEEPPYINNAVYPYNQVTEYQSGHIREVDDTPGEERIHEYHRTGTYYHIDKNGNKAVKVVGDHFEIIVGNDNINVIGNVNLSVNGNVSQYIKGNLTTQVDGNKTEVVQGNFSQLVKGDYNILSQGNVGIDGTEVWLNSGRASGLSGLQLTMPAEYELSFATPVIQAAGRYAAMDEPSDIENTPNSYPEDTPPPGASDEPKEESEAQDNPQPATDLGDCTLITLPVNYNTRLSPNFTIAALSTNALFAHRLQDQVGLTIPDLVCNAEALCKVVLEKIRSEFGSFRINSGFRRGSGRSQHCRFMAVDIQEPSWTPKKHLEVCEWIAKNVPFDQLIIEHGNSVWVHVSYDRTKSTQRGQIMTMYRGKFSPGLKLYY